MQRRQGHDLVRAGLNDRQLKLRPAHRVRGRGSLTSSTTPLTGYSQSPGSAACEAPATACPPPREMASSTAQTQDAPAQKPHI